MYTVELDSEVVFYSPSLERCEQWAVDRILEDRLHTDCFVIRDREWVACVVFARANGDVVLVRESGSVTVI